MVVEALLGGEQAWTPSFYLRSFDMDSVQVGKAVFVYLKNVETDEQMFDRHHWG